MNTTLVVSRSSDGDERKMAFEDALAGLCAGTTGLDVLIINNLYHLPEECDTWENVSDLAGGIILATWLYPRPAELLLRQHVQNDEPISAFDLGAYETAQDCWIAIESALHGAGEGGTVPGRVSEIEETVSQRWYPVRDASRCSDCGNCLQFCIFDVYAHDDNGHVTVANPDNCKPGCPACSRICPNSAIIFPEYRKDAAIAGATGMLVSSDTAEQARPELPQDAIDDIELLINDLENITRGKS